MIRPRHCALLALVGASACDEPAIPAVFQDSARETAPVVGTAFQGPTAAAAEPSFAIMRGEVRDEIYATLCDFDADDDCPSGVDNFYYALQDLDSVSLDTLGGEAASGLVVPFFGGTQDYDAKRSGIGVAWSKQGTELAILYYADTPSGTAVYQADLNQTTGELAMKVAGYWTSPGPGNGAFSLRAEIEGNRDSHEFTLRIAKFDPTDDSKPFLSFRGSGVSRGQDKYFLFLVHSENTVNMGEENGYHCIDALTMTDITGNSVREVHERCGGPGGGNDRAIQELAELTKEDLPSSTIDGTF